MSNAAELGKELRQIRKERGESLVQVAAAIKMDRSHLNKVELGEYMPSDEMLRHLISYFSLSEGKANRLLDLGGIKSRVVVAWRGPERGDMKDEDKKDAKQQGVNISVDPVNRPVLYTDSALVYTTSYGLTIDFAQTVGGAQNQHVVTTRVGMSYEHAKELIKAISEQIEKNER